MNLLIFTVENENEKFEELNSFSEIFSYHLKLEFEKREELNITFDNIPLRIQKTKVVEIEEYFKTIPNQKYDHIIAFGVASFRNLPKNTYKILKPKLKSNGKICHICDHNIPNHGNWDITFTQGFAGAESADNIYVNWAADATGIINNQDDNILRIFIDHPHYVQQYMKDDYTNKILLRLKELHDSADYGKVYNEIVIYRLINNGVETVNVGDIKKDIFNITPQQYNRVSITYDELIKLLSKTHIFIPTHKESLGLTVLEAAMSGNLILCQQGHILQDRLDTIVYKYVNFDKPLNWINVLNDISPEKCRNKAANNNFTELVNNMIMYLRG